MKSPQTQMLKGAVVDSQVCIWNGALSFDTAVVELLSLPALGSVSYSQRSLCNLSMGVRMGMSPCCCCAWRFDTAVYCSGVLLVCEQQQQQRFEARLPPSEGEAFRF
ncbi:hypothetical protein PHYPSEUDO_003540 [Phytophthora pseudosyringae]|uniref:Uncharacterized protein n=1 Tax=Phytophthora pseudosyringae TaxID=221518 RepID=A0A8T1VVQ2_9STRA|nr:hypothetical protein PHYPSEUDO_003540 [Phytophthora pseudosyringae]